MTARLRRVFLLIALLGLSAAAGLLLIADRCANPADRVMVSIHHIPERTVFACLACESGGALRKMYWYPTYFWVFTAAWDPEGERFSYRNPRNPDPSWGALPVKWLAAERYGVVTVEADGSGRITWFDARDVKISNASFLGGGGTTTLDLSQGRAVPLTDEDMGKLELNVGDRR